MLQANELMIGDWVRCGRRYMKITQLAEDMNCDDIEPVLLTPDILEENWFKIEEEYDETYETHDYYATLACVDSEKRNVEVNYHTFRNEITIFCYDSKNMLLYRNLETQIKYVHELQQIFKILKIDKEIVL